MQITPILTGETLYGLFGNEWEQVYNLDANADFRRFFPNPDSIKGRGWFLRYPDSLKPHRRPLRYDVKNPMQFEPHQTVHIVMQTAIGDIVNSTPVLQHIETFTKNIVLYGHNVVEKRNSQQLLVDGKYQFKDPSEIYNCKDETILCFTSKFSSDVLRQTITPSSILGMPQNDYSTAIANDFPLASMPERVMLLWGIDTRLFNYPTQVWFDRRDQFLKRKTILINRKGSKTIKHIDSESVLELCHALSKKYDVIITSEIDNNAITGSGFFRSSNFADFVNLIDQCSLLITPDTCSLHIRYALNKPIIFIGYEFQLDYLVRRRNNIVDFMGHEKLSDDGIVIKDIGDVVTAVDNLLAH